MANDRFGALRPLADLSGIFGFGTALAGTVFSAVKLTKELAADWPLPAQVLFYLGVFLLVYACSSGTIREAVRLYHWITKGTREPAIPLSAPSEAETAAVLPQILSGVMEMLAAHAQHLDRVDADTQRQKAVMAEEVAKRASTENEVLLSRFRQAEQRAQESESAARAALGAEATLLQEIEALKDDHKRQVDRAVEMLTEEKSENTKRAPLFEWAHQELEEASILTRWIEVRRYAASFDHVDTPLSAYFRVEITMRYAGSLPVEVGRTFDGALAINGRTFTLPTEILDSTMLVRGETKTVRLFQKLATDSEKKFIRDAISAQSLEIDLDYVSLSLRAQHPDGTQLKQQLRLTGKVGLEPRLLGGRD